MNDPIYQLLTEQVRGPFFRPGDDAYDEVRVIHNGMIDKRPGLLVRCSGVADVIDCVNFARENDILFQFGVAATIRRETVFVMTVLLLIYL